jgi:hypothetical protein
MALLEALRGRTLTLLIDPRSFPAFSTHFGALLGELPPASGAGRAGAPLRQPDRAPAGPRARQRRGPPAAAGTTDPGTGRGPSGSAAGRRRGKSRSPPAPSSPRRWDAPATGTVPVGAAPPTFAWPPPGSARALRGVELTARGARPGGQGWEPFHDALVSELADDRSLARRRRPRGAPGDAGKVPSPRVLTSATQAAPTSDSLDAALSVSSAADSRARGRAAAGDGAPGAPSAGTPRLPRRDRPAASGVEDPWAAWQPTRRSDAGHTAPHGAAPSSRRRSRRRPERSVASR